jgi:hypothetical protein
MRVKQLLPREQVMRGTFTIARDAHADPHPSFADAVKRSQTA